MKDDILNNLILTLDIPDKSIEILSKPNGQIEIGNGMSVTAEELRQIADLSDQFAIWIKQMRNYSK
jgi:hypothetical protein